MSLIEDPLAALIHPAPVDPDSPWLGWQLPTAAHPHVAATLPTPVSANPNVTRRRRGCANLFPGRRGRHAQPVHRFPLLSHFHLLARLPVAHFSVTFRNRLPLLGFALALNIHTLALNLHALLLCALAVHALTLLALAIEIHALVVHALAIHALSVLPLAIRALTVLAGMVLVLALAIHAFTVLALAILPLAIFAFAVFLVTPRGLIAIVVAVCPRRQRSSKPE